MIPPDVQSTFDYLYGLARKALETNRSFAPFASSVLADGARTHSATDLSPMLSEPGEHVAALLATLKRDAAGGGMRAAGLIFDSYAPLPEGGSDALCVHVETAAGEAFQIFVPYTRGRTEIPAYGEAIVQHAPARIFAG